MNGIWKGYYKFTSDKMRKDSGFNETNFTITITAFDGKKFKGIVVDDVDSGGMQGEGQIFGEIEGSQVSFQKLMPQSTLIYRNGKRKVLDRKHPTLYYSGIISPNKTQMEGRWKFKWQIVFIFGLIPIPYKPPSGTWKMSLQ